MSEKLPVYYVGWTPASSVDADLFAPTAPKSYTKAETIAAWVADAKAKGPRLPFVGAADSITVLSSSGEIVLRDAGAREFLIFADKVGRFHDLSIWDSNQKPFAVFAGLDIKELFLVIGARMRLQAVTVPLSFWRYTPGLVDSYESLVPGDLRNGFDLPRLLSCLGRYGLSDGALNAAAQNGIDGLSSEEKAKIAFELGKFSQLS